MPRPDEGLIHAWLDGQLPPDEAARIEELAATDPEWAAAVAEARGLVAASSRILSALDHVPAGVVPRGTATRSTRLPWWTKVAAAVVVVVGGSVVVMQNAPEGRMSVQSTRRDAAQPTPDTQQVVVKAPITSPPVRATETPRVRARVPAPAAGALADASTGRGDSPALRTEALAVSPVIPPSAPPPPVNAIVAEERKAAQDVERGVAEVPAAKSLVTKAAPSTTLSAAPTAAPQAQQTTAQNLAQAQNAVPAQSVTGGVIALRSAQEQQRQKAQQATLCYRIVPDNLRWGTAIIMRTVGAAGDTLFLAPVEPNASQRAWLVLRDGMRGVMTTGGYLRSETRITGTPAICPTP
ncbi:MAG: hypothetical protein Q8K55_14785 [Gemmatimonadaceae bacterium]|nr:hypothetical protein [Gemmatimonadaceae bacterium]